MGINRRIGMSKKIRLSGFADEIASPLKQQIETLKKLGVRYIEMRGVNGKSLVDHTLDEVRKIKIQLDAEGIKISAIGSPIGKILVTDAFEEHFCLYKKTVEIAKILETPNIRMFSFYIPKGEDPGKYRDEVFRRMKRFVEYAKEENVILLHENEKDIYGDIASRCLELMESFGGENFKSVFDFANFIQCRQETQKAYEMLEPYIAYIHIKDAIAETGKVVPAGYGDGKVKEILRQLIETGYEGFLSLEPHLATFNGFGLLEKGVSEKKVEMTGEEAYTMAYMALRKILEELNVGFC